MPNKAKLVTRQSTTSSVTTDNLNKGSALEFTELDSNMINLRDQTFGVAGDDSATIDVGAGDTLYIQGGTNVTTSTNSDGTITINSTASGGASLGDLQVGTFGNLSNQTFINPSVTNANLILAGNNAGVVAVNDSFHVQSSATGIDTYSTSVQTPNKLQFTGANSNGNTWKYTIASGTDTSQHETTIQLLARSVLLNQNINTDLIAPGGNGDFRIQNGGDAGAKGTSSTQLGHNFITLTDANDGEIVISPKTGKWVEIQGLRFPTADGTAGQVLKTNGSGILSFADDTGGTSATGIRVTGDDSAGIDIADGGTLYIQGGTNVTTSTNSDGTITINATDTNTGILNVVEDTTPQLGGNLDVNGQDIVTTSNANIELAPNGTGKTVLKGNTNPGTLIFNCENNSHGQTVIAQPHSASVTNTLTLPAGGDQEIAGTAATQTFTNKTLTSPVLNTGVSGTAIKDEDNMSSNSATHLATQQSIKAYVDAEVSGAGGGGVTVQDEGSALSTTATTLNFVGSGVAASGTGATKTITISGGGGGASTGDFTFTGNNMSTSSSNADMELGTSGTGRIIIAGNGGDFDNYSTQSRYSNANVMYYEDLNHTAGSDRQYKNNIISYYKLDGSNTSSSNYRLRNQNIVRVDLNGTDCTSTSSSRGPQQTMWVEQVNTSSDSVTQGNTVAVSGGNYLYEKNNPNDSGNINFTNMTALRMRAAEYENIGGTITNAYGIQCLSPTTYSYGGYSGDTLTVTNSYGYYYNHETGATYTNTPYAFYTNDDSVRNRPGAVEKFSEYSYNATHSGNGAYTIDWANGNLQTVTLGANITGFTMSNWPTSTTQSVGMTLYLVQDGSGSRAMTFSATGGETFKFANGVTTSSVSSANDIQTVYIFSRYNGSSNTFYWTLGPAYS